VRHVVFIFTFTICNVYYFLQRAAQSFGFHPHYSTKPVRVVYGISEVLFYMQGIIIPATRLLEPYYNRVFVRKLKKYFKAITF